MPTINDYMAYAETALAAYAKGLNTLATNVTAYRDAGMADSQAAAFDQQWSAMAQTEIGDGFSAVLFQNRITGEKVLGIRGTDASHWGIDYLTDVVNIAMLGTSAGMPQYLSLESFYQQLVSTGKLGASEQFTISGHSLGGFLAQAFTAKHPAVVAAAYTYNAPGFSVAPGIITNVGTELLEFFGITDASIPSSKIFNGRAVEGLSATSSLGQMLGHVDTFNIEMGGPIANHSIVTLTDSIASQAMLARLDPSVAKSTTNAMVLAACNQHDNTLESLLDAIRRTILGSAMAATGTENRNALYGNLKLLTDSGAFNALAGKVTLTLTAGNGNLPTQRLRSFRF